MLRPRTIEEIEADLMKDETEIRKRNCNAREYRAEVEERRIKEQLRKDLRCHLLLLAAAIIALVVMVILCMQYAA